MPVVTKPNKPNVKETAEERPASPGAPNKEDKVDKTDDEEGGENAEPLYDDDTMDSARKDMRMSDDDKERRDGPAMYDYLKENGVTPVKKIDRWAMNGPMHTAFWDAKVEYLRLEGIITYNATHTRPNPGREKAVRKRLDKQVEKYITKTNAEREAHLNKQRVKQEKEANKEPKAPKDKKEAAIEKGMQEKDLQKQAREQALKEVSAEIKGRNLSTEEEIAMLTKRSKVLFAKLLLEAAEASEVM